MKSLKQLREVCARLGTDFGKQSAQYCVYREVKKYENVDWKSNNFEDLTSFVNLGEQQ